MSDQSGRIEDGIVTQLHGRRPIWLARIRLLLWLVVTHRRLPTSHVVPLATSAIFLSKNDLLSKTHWSNLHQSSENALKPRCVPHASQTQRDYTYIDPLLIIYRYNTMEIRIFQYAEQMRELYASFFSEPSDVVRFHSFSALFLNISSRSR